MKKFTQSAFIRFFTRFHKLFLASLLYTVPLVLCTALCAFIAYLSGFNNIILWGLGLIPSFPLYAGFVMVVRKYAIEKTDCNIFKVFFDSVRENWKKFLVHGVATYAIVACSFFALLYYGTLAQTDIVYGSVFTLYILFSILLLVMMFYVPVMTVTYELRLRDIYKNSFLLIFGKIMRNIIALLLFVVVTALMLLAVIFSEGVMLVVSAVLAVALYPLIVTYLIIAIISKGLQDAVGSFTEKPVETVSEEEKKLIEQQAINKATDNDDYVFVNGRMIKNPAKKGE